MNSEKIKELHKKFEEGKTYDEVCDEEPLLNHNEVRAIELQWQLASYKKMKDERQRESVINLFKSGLTTKKIAKKLDLTKAEVTRYYTEWQRNKNAELEIDKEEVEVLEVGEKVQEAIDKSLDSSNIAEMLNYRFKNPEEDDNEPLVTIELDTNYVKVTPDQTIHDVRVDMDFKRGDIVLVSEEAYDVYGGMQGTRRPAIIISQDEGNATSTNVIVVYMTRQIKRLDLETHFVIPSSDKIGNSMILAEQIQTVNKRYIHRLEKLSKEHFDKLNNALLISLGLRDIVDNRVNAELSKKIANELNKQLSLSNVEKEIKVKLEDKFNKQIEELVIKHKLEMDSLNDKITKHLEEIKSLNSEIIELKSCKENAKDVVVDENRPVIKKSGLLRATTLQGEKQTYKVYDTLIEISNLKGDISIEKESLNSFINELLELRDFI